MLRTTFFANLVGLIAAKLSGQGVIITPGQTTFGPPIPIKPKNGECPVCHTQHPPIQSVYQGEKLRVICHWCKVWFEQEAE